MAQAKASGQVPPQAEKFLELPKLISAAELTFNLTGAGPMSLVVHATDEAAAQQIETLINEASNSPAVGRPVGYAAEETSPVAQAVTQYVERFSQPFRPQLNGTSVTLFRVEAQSAAHQQLASLAVFGIGAGMQAAQAAQSARAAALSEASPDEAASQESAPPAESYEYSSQLRGQSEN
jgi:hypothetical protein